MRTEIRRQKKQEETPPNPPQGGTGMEIDSGSGVRHESQDLNLA